MFRSARIAFLFIACFVQEAKAQNTNKQECRSQLYVRAMAPVNKILFLYRPELFTQKGFNKLADELTSQCKEKNVHVEFAVIRSERAESLALESDLVCRLNSTELLNNQLYQVRPGEFRKSILPGDGAKGYSILAFTAANSDTPVWKWNCNMITGVFKQAEKDVARSIFASLVSDGLIK